MSLGKVSRSSSSASGTLQDFCFIVGVDVRFLQAFSNSIPPVYTSVLVSKFRTRFFKIVALTLYIGSVESLCIPVEMYGIQRSFRDTLNSQSTAVSIQLAINSLISSPIFPENLSSFLNCVATS